MNDPILTPDAHRSALLAVNTARGSERIWAMLVAHDEALRRERDELGAALKDAEGRLDKAIDSGGQAEDALDRERSARLKADEYADTALRERDEARQAQRRLAKTLKRVTYIALELVDFTPNDATSIPHKVLLRELQAASADARAALAAAAPEQEATPPDPGGPPLERSGPGSGGRP